MQIVPCNRTGIHSTMLSGVSWSILDKIWSKQFQNDPESKLVSLSRLGDVNDNEEKSSQKVSERAETPGCFELLIVTAKQMQKKKQFLLIPLTIWSGLEQGFFGADFTAVRCLSDTIQDFLNKLGMKPVKSRNKIFFTK